MSRYLIYSEVFPSDGAGIARQTGVGRYCCELATGLAEAGHQVAVLTNHSQGEGLASDRLGFALERRGNPPGGMISALRRARDVHRAIARSRAEFVIAGDVISHKVLGSTAASGGARVLPVLYGSELRSFGSLFGEGRRSLGRRLRQRFVRRYLAGAFGAICISDFVARELRRLPIAPPRQLVVYPAVRPLVLTREPNLSFRLPGTTGGRAQGPVRLLTIGRISQRKNQLQVLQSVAELRDRAAVRCEYYIVGNVDADVHSPYFRAMQAFISARGLEDQVFMLPGTSDEEKVDCIDACDIVVAVSRTAGFSTEGFGISAIEGSARGKPVIVSREGGMPETIVEGVTGFSVAADPASDHLSRALSTLAASSDLRRRMGDAGREFVRQRFTPRRMAEALSGWLDGELHRTAAAALPGCESVR